MKKIFLVALATILFLFTVTYAAVDLSLSSNNMNPQTGQSFTITARATSSSGVEKIVYTGTQSPWHCFDDSDCTATFTFTENTAQQKDYTFIAYETGFNGGEISKTIRISISQPQSDTQEPTLLVNIPGQVYSNNLIRLIANAYDNADLSRINFKVRDSSNNVVKETNVMCFESTCTGSYEFYLTNPGTYPVTITATDAARLSKSLSGTLTVTLSPQISVYSSNIPYQPKVGEQITIKVSASSNVNLEKIEFVGRTNYFCFGEKICEGTFYVTETSSGNKNYAFKIWGEGFSSDVKDYTTSIYVAESGSGYDTPPAITLGLVNTWSLNQDNVVTLTATDDIGVTRVTGVMRDSTGKILSDSPWHCFDERVCNPRFIFRVSQNGIYTVTFTATDTTGHTTTKTSSFSTTGTTGGGGGDGGNNGGGNNGGGSGGGGSSGGSSSGGSGGGGFSSLASFKTIPTEIWVGEEVTFDASESRSSSSSATIKRYQWDFNGDSQDDVDTTSATTKYIYTQQGSYTVRLYTTDTNGMSSFTTRIITVKCCRLQTPTSLATFEIKTVDKSGTAVSDVLVSLKSKTSVYGVNTNANGTVQVKVNADCYEVTAEKTKYTFEKLENVCIASGETKSIVLKEVSTRTAGNRFTGLIGGLFSAIKNKPYIAIPIGILMIVAITGAVLYAKNSNYFRNLMLRIRGRKEIA